jgi:hypothetical protein
MDENSPEVRREYELLNIVDSKASALLTFNAVGLTALAVWLGYIPLNLLHLSLDIVFLALLVSCAFLLAIIALRWASKSTDVDVLSELRRKRSSHYRVAWAIAIGSVFCVIVVSAIHLIGTALIAFGVCGDGCQAFYSSNVFGNLDYGG